GSRGRTEIRILFAFDPERRGILLIAGDKYGNWNRWYREHIPQADEIFDAQLHRLKGQW
ncbi:MAG: diaminopimelate decarboxylase, partial [Rhodococcus sp.]|nr:diaminopimelate decarboxylase [Rhodococcus sp. (in: high G+C Gram-positive bacteria)]